MFCTLAWSCALLAGDDTIYEAISGWPQDDVIAEQRVFPAWHAAASTATRNHRWIPANHVVPWLARLVC